MSATQFSSCELCRNALRVKEAAKLAPVIITDRGKPTHVLLSLENYQRLTRQRRNIADALVMPEAADGDFRALRVTIGMRTTDLS